MPVTSGDPFGGIKAEKDFIGATPDEVKEFHKKSDKDSSIMSEHHTLGAKRNQSSPGDHIHDGKGCRKLGEGLSLAISGAKGSAASENSIVTMLANFITFTDNRV